jgi:hypothetical protein
VTSEGPDAVAQPGTDYRGLLLPPGSCLLHIGPPKTGTTAVQGAFHTRRAQTQAQGVHYAGRARHSGRAVQAVTGRSGFFSDGEQLDVRAWRSFVRDTRRPPGERVVVSSEFFADAASSDIPRILDDLGRERTHVVITLRPLARIMPSQWQQYVQSGLKTSFPTWLERILSDDPGATTPTFWQRHRHDDLVRRWVDAVGRDAVTVVAVDDADHAMIMRVFEGLTGLSSGTLVADREVANRSLTLPEIEAVRAFNRQLADEGLPRSAQSRLMHFGAARYLMQFEPDPSAARVVLPRWAAERAHELSSVMVAGVADTGVRVVGDLASLTVPVGDAPESIPKTVDVPAKVAARMAVGIVLASGEARRSLRGQAAQPAAEMPQVSRTTSLELARVIAMRGRAASVQKLKSLREKTPGTS